MDYASMFALGVASAAGKILENSARIIEAADTFYFWCFGVEHCTIQCSVGISTAEVQLVGLAGDKWSAFQCGDHDALLDGRDLVERIVCESKGNQLLHRSFRHPGALTERSYDVCSISRC
jgi:hypothetical protein